MKRKKPVLKTFEKEIEITGAFRKVLELGLLLALKERNIISQYQFDIGEEKVR